MKRSTPMLVEPDPDARERRIATALFFVTCWSVFLVYLLRWQTSPVPEAGWRALEFTVTLMTILLAHEMGHYATARHHGIRLGLPWFLPAPILVGTLGAVIRWADVPRTRSGLLEMAAMGPLAGLLVVVPIVAIWLLAGPVPADDGITLARPLLWWVIAGALTGRAPPPLSPQDPLGFAAWIGALVTALNLLPMGQLDGGHVLRALTPSRSSAIGWIVTGLLLLAGLFWPGWAIWAALVHLIGRPDATVRESRPPDGRARALAVLALIAFILCFTPVPV